MFISEIIDYDDFLAIFYKEDTHSTIINTISFDKFNSYNAALQVDL